MTLSEIALLLFGVGSALLLLSSWALVRWGRSRRHGRVVAVDRSPEPGRSVRSERYALVGRPDELRRLRDGRLVPVEVKSRPSPRRGPPALHRVQLLAYAFLIEEETGVAPPYGVLRYGDGREFVLEYGPDDRAEVLRLLHEVRRPYDGAATPAPAKCRACSWAEVCDARAY